MSPHDPQHPARWRRGLPVWLTLAIALAALGGGLAVGTQLTSPADIAAQASPPPPGLITAKIEQRQLTAQMTVRADVSFADPVSVEPSVPAGADAAVVTGRVPQVGATVNAGDVIIEVSGRPVFVLPGSFPTYRSLGPGSVGPDVRQLRAALNGLGLKAGADSDTYDAALAGAVQQLYKNAGYPAPGSDDLSKTQAVRDAQDALTDAQSAQTQAQNAYKQGQAAAQQVAAAKAKDPSMDAAVPDLTSLNQAVTDATRAVTRAQEALTSAQQAAWATMPAGEVVFVTDLPRRVDSVGVGLGQTIGAATSGEAKPAVVLSGATITIVAHVQQTQAGLVVAGQPVQLEATDGSQHAATVVGPCPTPAADATAATATCDVALTLNDPASADPATLVGNIRATITVGTSSPDALVVPVAAVSANASGQAQVQLVTGALIHDAPADQQPTSLVPVQTGLSADGYVEVTAISTPLQAGDLVVLGIGTAATPSASASVESTPK